MKWFQHNSNDRNEIESKLIRSKFKAEGYGIFCALKEVIAEYVEKENIGDWGYVNPLHTIETLADECATTPEKLKEFLAFCDDDTRKIFEKRNGRLYYEGIIKRLDTFAERVRREHEASAKSVRSETAHTIQHNTLHNNTKQKYTSITSLTEGVVQSVANDYSVSAKAVRDLKDELILYCKSKGKSYRDYRATLMNWVRRRISEGKLTRIIQPAPLQEEANLTPEQIEANHKRIQDIKSNLKMKGMS